MQFTTGRAALAAAAILLATAALAEPAPGTAPSAQAAPPAGVAFRHLEALQAIADANGGNRAAGTPGYAASAAYVADRLREAGYTVRIEPFTYPHFEERSPPVLASGAPGADLSPQPRGAVRTLQNSGRGDATAALVPVDVGEAGTPSTSGCEAEDFAAFPAGAVALVRRGTCPFQAKAANAAQAGAAGLVIMNEGRDGRDDVFGGALGGPAPLPVVGVPHAAGRALERAAGEPGGVRVRLAVDAEAGERESVNVIAERPGQGAPALVAGAHLDSVREGPGINDNGSGTAALLEAALRLAREPARPIRFAFWGAEEVGLIGSRRHVERLPEEERRGIALYVNLDMVGSPNPGRFVQSSPGRPGGPDASGSGANREGLAEAVRAGLVTHLADLGLPAEERKAGTLRGYGSDDASFAARGIPTVGLYTGAGERKSEAHAALFGGEAGKPFDPCYHRACDGLGNIDRTTLEGVAEALVRALRGAADGRG
jgi:Zn-dependent M28 family amino/carboxypeptidase